MTTLSALRFSAVDGAQRLESTLLNLKAQQIITVYEAALVTWPPGNAHPETRELDALSGPGALHGAFWGMVFDLIFYAPSVKVADNATAVAHAGRLAEFGIDEHFIQLMRDKVTEGTSALFLLTRGAVMDKVADAVESMDFEIISTNLTPYREAELRAAFGTE